MRMLKKTKFGMEFLSLRKSDIFKRNHYIGVYIFSSLETRGNKFLIHFILWKIARHVRLQIPGSHAASELRTNVHYKGAYLCTSVDFSWI